MPTRQLLASMVGADDSLVTGADGRNNRLSMHLYVKKLVCIKLPSYREV